MDRYVRRILENQRMIMISIYKKLPKDNIDRRELENADEETCVLMNEDMKYIEDRFKGNREVNSN